MFLLVRHAPLSSEEPLSRSWTNQRGPSMMPSVCYNRLSKRQGLSMEEVNTTAFGETDVHVQVSLSHGF